jgi:preprotein translocase subunit YajC
VVIEVHSQAILRLVEPDLADETVDEIDAIEDDAPTSEPETPEQTRNRLDRDSDN